MSADWPQIRAGYGNIGDRTGIICDHIKQCCHGLTADWQQNLPLDCQQYLFGFFC